MSEFGGLRKDKKIQHALKSGIIISSFIVATIWMKKKKKNIINFLVNYVKSITVLTTSVAH